MLILARRKYKSIVNTLSSCQEIKILFLDAYHVSSINIDAPGWLQDFQRGIVGDRRGVAPSSRGFFIYDISDDL